MGDTISRWRENFDFIFETSRFRPVSSLQLGYVSKVHTGLSAP